jgi:diacylglycerol kinase (ATP)|tara:strand:- start:85 stop:435 length:351 start_codon:yes stop_codon:yes gene_type:complete
VRIGLNRYIKYFFSLLEEFKEALKNENVLRQEFFLSLVLIPTGFLIGETSTQKILLISSILLIPISEILNYSIKFSVEIMLKENQHLSKKIKHIGSTAIFLAIGNVFITWILILFF